MLNISRLILRFLRPADDTNFFASGFVSEISRKYPKISGQ
nr:MAG TPA: hypothetical protein [Caudoviricetes sp.]